MDINEEDISEIRNQLASAVTSETEQFKKWYQWLLDHMPQKFIRIVNQDTLSLATHNLMTLHLQKFQSFTEWKGSAVVLCLDDPKADLKILKHYKDFGIKNYRSYVSKKSLDLPGAEGKRLRFVKVDFTESKVADNPKLHLNRFDTRLIWKKVQKRFPEVTLEQVENVLYAMNPRFLQSMTQDRLEISVEMYFRAQSRDQCQYITKVNKEWDEHGVPSLQVMFAWRNVPKYGFLYKIAKIIDRHKLNMSKVNATIVDPYSKDSILIMSLGLNGKEEGISASEAANLNDFLEELATTKFFDQDVSLETVFVKNGLLTGNEGNLLKSIVDFVHQCLVHVDLNMYTPTNIEEAFCCHPKLTKKLITAFHAKLHPQNSDLDQYSKVEKEFFQNVEKLDTGHLLTDMRRKNVLKMGMNFVHHILKTNYYRTNKQGHGFRLDPQYIEYIPFDYKKKFPETPFGIFFIRGSGFIGFHIRFKDLSRGGLRTVWPKRIDQAINERNNTFAECYNLAFTQQKKNKDIPEGGAKGIICLNPYDSTHETAILKYELNKSGLSKEEIEEACEEYDKAHRQEHLYQAQRSFIDTFVILINSDDNGNLTNKDVLDYWKKPEYIYLGPDENMRNPMIDWITEFSKHYGYRPGSCFMSSKPRGGINHKEYGVTSLGVFIYMVEVLKFMGIDPENDIFTVKITGGPDGDVAGNMIKNLYNHYPKTAQIKALTDGSGTIYDPNGLDLKTVVGMFEKEQPINAYPPEKLSEGSFLLDLWDRKKESAYATLTRKYVKQEGEVVSQWLSGDEMNDLFRHNVHKTKTDVFIPAGGRPRTLNEANWEDFLDENGIPTSRAVVEGANLYLTPEARRHLEKAGALIIKDSSANKGGVICSSFEILGGLVMNEEEFVEHKDVYMTQVLKKIEDRARDEAQLMLRTYQTLKEGGNATPYLTDISDWVSERINLYKYQILEFLENKQVAKNRDDVLIKNLLKYAPDLLRVQFEDRLIHDVPEIHQKAVIACFIGSQTVYQKGLGWEPSIVDILPILAKESENLASE